MDNLIKKLTNVLEEEADIYNKVLETSKDKTAIIVEGKVSDLEKIVKLEQTFIMQLSRLESHREELITKISEIEGINQEDITISGLIKTANEEQKEALKKVQDRIVNAIEGLKNANALNSRLIKNSLDYINFSLGMFTNIEGSNSNYDMKAEMSPNKNRNLFDLKI